MSIKVDTRGKLCPLPLMMLRKAIKENPEESEYEIWTDNEISCSNLQDFIKRQGFQKEVTQEEGYTSIRVNTGGQSISPRVPAAEEKKRSNANSSEGFRVVQLRSDKMGRGDDELGGVLMMAFLNALKEQDTLPTHIICYNSGVKLAMNGNETATILQELHAKGVEIIVCGTCVNYYDIRESLALGIISNMFDIVEILSAADSIVCP